MSTYKLTTHGQLLDGYSLEDVKNKVATLFKLDPKSNKFNSLFSGEEITIKKGLDKNQAQKYCNVLKQTGLDCELIAESAMTDQHKDTDVANIAAEQPQATTDINPYQQPQANLAVENEEGDFDLIDPQKLSAGSAWTWIKEGYYYFKQAPLAWIVSIIIYMAIMMAGSFIPILSIATNILMPVFVGGLMLGCYKLYNNEDFEISDLFAGFKTNFNSLAAVGGLFLLGSILVVLTVLGIMFAVYGGLDFIENLQGGLNAASPMPFMLSLLIGMSLYTILLMAYWFAPALVIINSVTAVDAMRLSFKACLKNVIPFLVYGIILTILSFVAAIPIFLGFIVLIPVVTASIFATYRQIFTHTEDVV